MRTVECNASNLLHEKGFFEAIEFHLPNIRRFLCWNHAINAVKFWLRKHGATASEVPVYVSDIRDLLHQETEMEYNVNGWKSWSLSGVISSLVPEWVEWKGDAYIACPYFVLYND